MTKPELINKHPALLTPESAVIMSDLAAHMRRGVTTVGPQYPKNSVLDGIATARKLEHMEGWLAACEYIQQLHIKPAEQKPQETTRPYADPNPQNA